jgi:NADH:ubiquinone oxidoreductase subunit C
MADDVPVTSAPGAKYDVVRELYERFGQNTFVFQSTLDDVPTLWVPRAKLVEVLAFLRQAPRPYVMLLDLSAVDERLRKSTARACRPPTSRCSITCCRSTATAMCASRWPCLPMTCTCRR